MLHVAVARSPPTRYPTLNTWNKCRKFEDSVQKKQAGNVKAHYGRSTEKIVLSLRFMASDWVSTERNTGWAETHKTPQPAQY